MIYDDVIMRTIIDLPEEQVRGLAALCEAQGISRAEAVRRAVARLLAEEQRLQPLAGIGHIAKTICRNGHGGPQTRK